MNAQDNTEIDTQGRPVPFSSPTEARDWLAAEIARFHRMANGKKQHVPYLRLTGQLLDTWSKLHRLSVDTEEVQKIGEELESLKAEINKMIKGGPSGVVAHGQD